MAKLASTPFLPLSSTSFLNTSPPPPHPVHHLCPHVTRCTISDALGGCIPSDTSTYALAMGPLRNANSLFRPLRMVVTGWSDKSTAIAEPLVAKAAQASYALDLKDSGLKQGDAFTLFRSVVRL